ncbi:HAMP domain-containing sensor histidine kinase [Oceanirhabdus seepicola]|uniref:histidine kinase n=1 Tax=Oceanirhabdus seepicola TaxID=2828781 RepID=A0A9J6NXJ8_9CLOT|nr:histidine kinase dimerization/phospho-acceptor domain-containing protein [Oceanirhabdus seepicola]MCM1988349.1 GHKL domain-containing protein [Oceanirhabdus seepicola]
MSKNFINKIHVQIIFVIILSLGISISVFLGLSELNNELSLKRKQALINELKETINDNVNQIKHVIDKNDMTFQDVLNSDIFEEYNKYDIYLTSLDGKLYPTDKDVNEHFDDLDLQSEYLSVFNIKYKDGFGIILIKPNFQALVSDIYEVIIGTFSISLFLILLLLLTKNQIKYIKKINDGIEIMAGGELTSEITVEGNNELTNLAISINSMASSLHSKMDLEKELDRKQRKLITNISHDLRTPLTSLIGYLDLLSNHSYESVSEGDKYVDIALTKSKRLQKLIEDLFVYTKLVNQDVNLDIEKVDICMLLSQFVDEIQPNLIERNLKTKINSSNTEILVPLDVSQILRVLENIFNNITKYGRENSTISISINEHDEKAIIKITNETDLDLTHSAEFLFDRLYVSDENRHNQSSGIGLSIVEEIVKLHGGNIYAKFDEPLLSIVIELDIYSDKREFYET